LFYVLYILRTSRVLCTKCMKWVHVGLGNPVCPHDSTREPLDGFGLNLVWTLCHRSVL
jgi:hypothetical protein